MRNNAGAIGADYELRFTHYIYVFNVFPGLDFEYGDFLFEDAGLLQQ